MQDAPQILKLSLKKEKKFDYKTHPKFFPTNLIQMAKIDLKKKLPEYIRVKGAFEF